MTILINQLRRARELAGMTQRELGERMGLTGRRSAQAAVAALEAGRHDPRLSTLLRAAWALGLELVLVADADPDAEKPRDP